jgi:tartrate dehydrogenase/decarboxylase/D-malate dehydrogenase
MNHYNLAVIPGDGIGNEVMPVVLDVLTQLGKMTGAFQLTLSHFDWGSDYYGRHGRMMPDDGLKQLESFDAIYFGAVGSPDIPDGTTLTPDLGGNATTLELGQAIQQRLKESI